MPNSAALSAETSTTSASTKICARRTSSLSTTARILLYKGSDAITSKALLAASACIVTPAAAKPAALPATGDAVTVAVAPAPAAVAVVIPPEASPPALGASDAAGVNSPAS